MALVPATLGSPERIPLPAMCGSRAEPTGKLPASLRSRPGDAPGALDLNKLFVEPRHIRGGVGRALPAHVMGRSPPIGLRDAAGDVVRTRDDRRRHRGIPRSQYLCMGGTDRSLTGLEARGEHFEPAHAALAG